MFFPGNAGRGPRGIARDALVCRKLKFTFSMRAISRLIRKQMRLRRSWAIS